MKYQANFRSARDYSAFCLEDVTVMMITRHAFQQIFTDKWSITLCKVFGGLNIETSHNFSINPFSSTNKIGPITSIPTRKLKYVMTVAIRLLLYFMVLFLLNYSLYQFKLKKKKKTTFLELWKDIKFTK